MCRMRGDTKSMTGKTTEGLAWGVSKRAMAAGAGGILRTGDHYFKKTKKSGATIISFMH